MNYHAGKFDEAEQQLRQSIELDKNRPFVFGTWLLGKVYVATGKYDLALQELGKAVGNSRGSSWTRSMLAHALGASGEPGKAQEILADLQDADKHGCRGAALFQCRHERSSNDLATILQRSCNDPITNFGQIFRIGGL
jgi:predicted Zn-dependent protease